MVRATLTVLTAILWITIGCDSAQEEQYSPTRQPSQFSSSGMTLLMFSLNGDTVTPTAKANVTAKQLESQLRSTDWSQRPLPQISLSKGGRENLSILAEHAAPDQPIVVWSTAEGSVPAIMKFGPIDPGGAETLDLFLSYLNQDDNYKTMVEWREHLDVHDEGGQQ